MRIRKDTVIVSHMLLGKAAPKTIEYLWRHGLTHLVLGGRPEVANQMLCDFDYYFQRLTVLGADADDIENLLRQGFKFGVSAQSIAWYRLLRTVVNLVSNATRPAVALLQCGMESEVPQLVNQIQNWLGTSGFDDPWAKRVTRSMTHDTSSSFTKTLSVLFTRTGFRAIAYDGGGHLWGVAFDGELSKWKIETGMCCGRWETHLQDVDLIGELDSERVVLGNTTGYCIWWTLQERLDEWRALPGLVSVKKVLGDPAGLVLHTQVKKRELWLGWPVDSDRPRETNVARHGEKIRVGESAFTAHPEGSSIIVTNLMSGEQDALDAAIPIQGVVSLSETRFGCWGNTSVQIWRRKAANSRDWWLEYHHEFDDAFVGVDRVSADALVVWPKEKGDVVMVTSNGEVRKWQSPWIGYKYKGVFSGSPRSLGHGTLVCSSSDRESAYLASLHVPSGARSDGLLGYSATDVGPASKASKGRLVASWPDGPFVEKVAERLLLWPTQPLGAPVDMPIDNVREVIDLAGRRLGVLTAAGAVHVVGVQSKKGHSTRWGIEPHVGSIRSVHSIGKWVLLEEHDDWTLVVRSTITGRPIMSLVSLVMEQAVAESKFGRFVHTEIHPFPNIDKLPNRSALSLPSAGSIALHLNAYGRLNEPLRMVVRAEDTEVTVQSECVLQPAHNAGLDESFLRKKFGTLGGTAYRLNKLRLDLPEGLYIPGAELVTMRRRTIDLLSASRPSLIKYARSSAGLLFTLANGETFEWVSNDPGQLWDITYNGIIRASSVVSIWKGKHRLVLKQDEEINPEEWLTAVLDSLEGTEPRWVTSDLNDEPEEVRLLANAFRRQGGIEHPRIKEILW